ncbi:MAG: hypothetical protein OEW67_00330 [Cyclobacteriaceae bacterium]|nr:hypothetical protein [Cyclobacteriaceae bacterium]
MKKLSYLLSAIVLLAILFTIGCKPDPTPGPSAEEAQKALLVKTWTASSVTLNNEDVTADFSGFTLTIQENLNYTSSASSLTRSPQPWPTSGGFAFGVNGDGTTNVNQLLREPGGTNELPMTVQVDETTMTLGFTFTDGTHLGGRTEAISGDWVFSFTN